MGEATVVHVCDQTAELSLQKPAAQLWRETDQCVDHLAWDFQTFRKV